MIAFGENLQPRLVRNTALALCLIPLSATLADERSAQACRQIMDSVARLACYDAALSATEKPAPPSPASPAISAGAPQTAPHGPSPSTKPAENALSDTWKAPSKSEPIPGKRLAATVEQAVKLGPGFYRLTLDNGQVWQTTQPDPSVDFESRNSVLISRTMTGHYLISRTGQPDTVWVKRIQ